MIEDLLVIDDKNQNIKILGIDVDAKLEQIKVLVNGIDITKNLKIKELKIIKEV